MKSPTALAYLFGNPLSFLAVLGATVFVGYEALTGQASGWLAIILIAAFGFSLKCQNYLSSYGRWKREWDAMNGQPPKPPMFVGMSWLRYPLGIVAWIFGVVMALGAANHPYEQWAGDVFWVGSLLGIGALLLRAIKAMQRTKSHTQAIAVGCVNVPWRSAAAARLYGDLPSYCLKIMARSDHRT